MDEHKVHCFSLDVTNWDTAPSFQVREDRVDVWRAGMILDEAGLRRAETLLSQAELIRAGRYHHDKDRRRFITSRSTLRLLLGQYLGIEPGMIEFTLGPNKKPYLSTPKSRLHFNTSHVDNYVLIAIAFSEIGVDLERLDTGFEWRDILASAFSTEEINFVNESKMDAERSFYTLWTRKEALAKATGKGLQDDFSVYPSLDGWHDISGITYGGNWELASFTVDDFTIGSLAYPAAINSRRFLTFKSDSFDH